MSQPDAAAERPGDAEDEPIGAPMTEGPAEGVESVDVPTTAAGPSLPLSTWPIREQVAFVLCHTREPGHLDVAADFCRDCLDQADRLLDEAEIANALWCALHEVEDTRDE